jgi:phosphoglycerate dehydrogenase-like enzyme
MPHTVYVTFYADGAFRGDLIEALGKDCQAVFVQDSSTPPPSTEGLLITYSSASAPIEGKKMGTSDFLAEWCRRLPSLRVIQTVSAGVDGLPFEMIPEAVTILSNAGAYAEPMAEHAFAMILALAKNLMRNHELLRQGVFDQKTPTDELRGKVLGVLGYGGVGRAVARLANCFGIRVYALNRRGVGDEYVDKVYTLDGLDRFLSECDILVVTAPLNNQSRNMLNAARLNLMKEDAILVNLGRAAVISESDLYHHLSEHRRFRVALDVWWKEPSRDTEFSTEHPFLELPNFLGSPHNSGVVRNMFPRVALSAANNLRLFFAGSGYRNVVERSDYL